MYRRVFDLFLSRIDPEKVHHLSHRAIGLLGRVPVLPAMVGDMLRGGRTRAELDGEGRAPAGHIAAMGLAFPGHLGLAAGYDKDASAAKGLFALGFAFIEVGTITAQGQPGNERPRLWRLTDRDALRNRMGFNNPGARAAQRTLKALRRTRSGRAVIVGVNIGKTKVTDPDLAAYDYATSARLLAPYADYLVVNVSSPNTPGLRELQSVERLRPILRAVRRAADDAAVRTRTARTPLAVKIAPDLADDDIDAICDLALELRLDAIVAVNTTIDHELGPGGLSGPPELARGLEVVRRVRERCGDRLTIMGVGGISSEADARAYLRAGADLLQAFTALIYQGPLWPGRINRALIDAAPGGPARAKPAGPDWTIVFED